MNYKTTAKPIDVLFRDVILNPEGHFLLDRASGALPEVRFQGHGLQGFWAVEATELLLQNHGVEATVLYVQENFKDIWQPDGSVRATLVMELQSAQLPPGLEWSPEKHPPKLFLQPWQHPGWFARAKNWIQEQLGPVQVQQLWSTDLSCLLSTETCFFKVSSEQEGKLTQWLHQRHPQQVPRVHATLPAEGWMLVERISGDLLVDAPDLESWKRAFTSLILIQQDAIQHLTDLERLGLSRWNIEQSLLDAQNLLDDPAFLQQQNLSPEQIASLQAQKPALLNALCALQEGPVPHTLVHGDFHAYNVISPGVILDWNEASISHPLLDVARCLSRLPAQLKAHHSELRDHCLKSWTQWATLEDLRTLYQHSLQAVNLLLAVHGHRNHPDSFFAGFHLKLVLSVQANPG